MPFLRLSIFLFLAFLAPVYIFSQYQCGPWTCEKNGFVKLILSPNEITIGVGERIEKPRVGRNYKDGSKIRHCTGQNPSPSEPELTEWDERLPVTYRLIIFLPSNMPIKFDKPGKYIFTFHITGYPDDPVCDIITDKENFIVNVGYTCDHDGDGVNESNYTCGDDGIGNKTECYACDKNLDGKLETCKDEAIVPCHELTSEEVEIDKLSAMVTEYARKIPYVKIKEIKVEAWSSIKACDCCKPPIVPASFLNHIGEISGNFGITAKTSGKQPIPSLGFMIEQRFPIWWGTHVSVAITGGLIIHYKINFGAEANINIKCSDQFCWAFGIHAGASLKLEIIAMGQVCYDKLSKKPKCYIIQLPTIYATSGVSGELTYNSCGGTTGKICISPLTAGLEYKLPWIGTWNYTIIVWGQQCYP